MVVMENIPSFWGYAQCLVLKSFWQSQKSSVFCKGDKLKPNDAGWSLERKSENDNKIN